MECDALISLSGDAAFLDPPALLSCGYAEHNVDPAAYYARAKPLPERVPMSGRKRKRKGQSYVPNNQELNAERRHQEARTLLLAAHEAFLSNVAAAARLEHLRRCCFSGKSPGCKPKEQAHFVQLSQLFQAPLYDITFSSEQDDPRRLPLFNTLAKASSAREELACCAGCTFVLPKDSQFLMSDFSQIHRLVPETPLDGYNLLVIDPPWENKSVHRRSLYPTLPNKYLLSLPLQRLVHPEGALIGLWITNREKLRRFVEQELFPAWGVRSVGVWYWLKVTEGGQMVSELDSRHHKPYECLLLATTADAALDKGLGQGHAAPPRSFVVISVPGEHSRKPPLGLMLSEFAPGPRPVKAAELFAREMSPGWTSWGNEPLHFQNKVFFRDKGPAFELSQPPAVSQ